MRNKRMVVFIFAILLVACVPITLTATPAPIGTSTSILQTPLAPTPTQMRVTPTPTTKAERWKDYENALAAVFLPLPDLPGKGFCKWELLAQAQDKVYVWAICQTDSAEGAAMSAPAVIDLGANGVITKVEVPKDGTDYGPSIRQMFPTELQEKILSQSVNTQVIWTHLQARHKTSEVSLIVATGVMLP